VYVGQQAPTPLAARVPAPRPSAADREWVIRRLRSSCEDERLSLDTFAARVELAYAAQSQAELGELLVDLRRDHGLARAVLDAAAWLSWWTARLRGAWRQPRTPQLVLPLRESVVLGRSRACGCILCDSTVSRRHASIRHDDGAWWLRDLGSTNGTYVNGWRIVDEVEVRPGDEVSFGAATYRLAPAAALRSHAPRDSRSPSKNAA
jgi:FHA domain/Domain of unknown function (DUF1707)